MQLIISPPPIDQFSFILPLISVHVHVKGFYGNIKLKWSLQHEFKYIEWNLIKWRHPRRIYAMAVKGVGFGATEALPPSELVLLASKKK